MARVLSLRAQRGVSLLEVLIAIVIFSVGVLGLALMQLKGAQFTKQSGSRGAVIMQTRSLTDAMRGNSDAAAKPLSAANPAAPSATDCPYCYDGSKALTVTDCVATTCTSAQIAANDIANWKAQLAKAAPSASTGLQGTIVWSAALGTYTITATWYDGGLKRDNTSEGDQSYSINYLP